MKRRKFVRAGDVVRIELAYSEVCMDMGVSGQVRDVRVTGQYMAEILDDDGREFCAPVTPGEAGFYWEGDRLYCYPEGKAERGQAALFDAKTPRAVQGTLWE